MKHIKRLSALFSAIVFATSFYMIAQTETSVLLGDINKDGSVTAADARLALLTAAGLYSDSDIETADIDNDGKITSIDARFVLRAAAKLENLFCIRYGHDLSDGSCINCNYTDPTYEPDSEIDEQTTETESATVAPSEPVSVTETTTEAETTTTPEEPTTASETTTETTTASTTIPETTTEPESVTKAPEEFTTAPESTTTVPEESTTAPETTTETTTAPTTIPETTTEPDSITKAPEEFTTAPESTTAAPEESTTASETTTETTTAPTTIPETTTKPVSTKELAYETFLLINEYRASLGLYPFTFNAELSEITLVRARETSVLWSHTRPDGRDFWSVFGDYNKFNNVQVGEILAKIGSPDAQRAVNGWINSPSHNAILTTTKYNQIGIACYLADDGYCYFTAHTIKTDYNESTTITEESTTTGTTPPVSTENLAYDTFLIINEYRASLGLYPLTFNAELSEITLARAKEISVCWGSTRPDGRDFQTIFDDYNKFNNGTVSEIMAKFRDPDASQVVSSLYNSPFSNVMLTSTYNQIGIAYHLAENGYYYFVIHTMQ